MTKVQRFLEQDPTAAFIDVGANIGMYALSIAKMGRKVHRVFILRHDSHFLFAPAKKKKNFGPMNQTKTSVTCTTEAYSLLCWCKQLG